MTSRSRPEEQLTRHKAAHRSSQPSGEGRADERQKAIKAATKFAESASNLMVATLADQLVDHLED
jgi:hypothetical protein